MNNLSPTDRDLAKRFIDRELSITEVEAINERIKTDKVFADALAYHMAMKKAFEARANRPQKVPEKVIAFSSKRRKLWIPAALLIGVLGIWGLIHFNQMQRTTLCQQELTTFQHSIQPAATLGGLKEVDKLIIQGDFDKAIDYLTDLRNRPTATDKCKDNLINYKLGILLLYHNSGQNAKEAITPLECLANYYPTKYPKLEVHLARAKQW